MRVTDSVCITARARVPVLFVLLLFSAPEVADEPAAMAGDAPGALPSAGTSLFDRLLGTPTAGGLTYDVPYPFERLLTLLAERLAPASGGRSSSLATALIPYGRSLQRQAARPDFFRYPRIVLAVDGQAETRLPTADRLFIGYQEKAGQIEIISYNEESGRFEFQVVTNYAEGKTPVVHHAPRALCTSCHQNASAVFPRRPWAETNSNRRVAERIGAFHQRYHGIAVDSTSSGAGRIDGATDRANLFPVYQLIWREGCRLPDDRAGSLRCRAGAFKAMLRYRLGIWASDRPEEDEAYVRTIVDNWRKRWPEGLAIPDADLSDRAISADSLPIELPPRLDPLSPRPARTHWKADRDLSRTIRGLADAFLLTADIERLDRGLHRRSRDAFGYYAGDCRVKESNEARGNTWIEFKCVAPGGRETAMSLVGELNVDAAGRVDQGLNWLYVAARGRLAYASLSGAVRPAAEGIRSARLSLHRRYGNIRARMPDGAAMSRFHLFWNATPGAGYGRAAGHFKLVVSRDFEQVEQATGELLQKAGNGTFDGFDDRAFRGLALMNALFDQLDIDYPPAASSVRARPEILPEDSEHGRGDPPLE